MANLEYMRNIVNQKENVNEVTVKVLDSRVIEALTVKVSASTGDLPPMSQAKAVEDVLASIFDRAYMDSQVSDLAEKVNHTESNLNETIEKIESTEIKINTITTDEQKEAMSNLYDAPVDGRFYSKGVVFNYKDTLYEVTTAFQHKEGEDFLANVREITPQVPQEEQSEVTE